MWFFGPFSGTPVVFIGTEQHTYQTGTHQPGVGDNAANVSAGTDAAHELTHKITHIGDIPYKGQANLMNVDDGIKQLANMQKSDPNARLASGDPYRDNISSNIKDFANTNHH